MQYIIFLEFLVLAATGLVYHYYEKKFLHQSTACSFKDYMFKERTATYKALTAIIVTCYAFTTAHTGGYLLALSEVGGALMAGYGFDNAFNKAPE